MKTFRLVWMSLALAGAACGGGGEGTPDAAPSGPDADLSNCLLEADRTEACVVDLQGMVADFLTGTRVEIGGAPQATYINVTTAFDGPTPFPLNCPTLRSFPAPAQTGEFNQVDVPCDSNQLPPTLLLLIDDPPGAPNRVASTTITFPLTCTGSDCGAVNATLPALLASDVTTWRTALNGDGVPNAFSRGLVFIQYLETDGTPAAGVTPTITDTTGERPLTPGSEVRFMGSDRIQILGSTQTVTSPSGVAMVLLDGDTAVIGGTRTTDSWPTQPVLVSNGYINIQTARLP